MAASQPKKRRTTNPSTNDTSVNSDASFEDVEYAGRVVSIQMVNFMCHSNLEIPLNRRVNFISGRNGSGKSAVMAGLVVVLGGTAVNTQRGTSVADFIKKGQSSGRVSIELLNEGINAYKPDEYGNRIYITRSFTRSGTNNYIVKSANGEVVSKKKKEVEKICEMLRLDVTNPICVLNQDVARSFLTSSDSKLRYELFMKATQLKQLNLLHSGTVAELTKSWNDLEKKSALLGAVQKELQELTKKLNFLKTLETVTEEKKDLENEFLWAGVIDDENALKAITEERESIERKLEEISDSDKNYDSRMIELTEELNELKNDLTRVLADKEKLVNDKRVIHEEVMKIEREITRFESQLEFTLPKLQRTLGDLKKVREYMDEIDERNSRSAADCARMTERVRVAQADLKSVEECYVAAERDAHNAEETKAGLSENLRSVSNLIKDMVRNKEHKLNQLEGLRGQDDMEAVKYGPFVPKLLIEVEKAVAMKRFSRKPIGPIGMYVKLTSDSKWGPAVESVIGALLPSYCCENVKDFRILEQIMNQVAGKRQPTIIISKFQFQRHNVANSRVHVQGYLSVLDAISIDDDTVFNTLIDQCHIEKVLLLDKDEQAAGMLTRTENVPRHLRMAVTMACDRYFPAPSYRTYAGRVQNRYFNRSSRKEDVIKQLETAVNEIEMERKLKAEEKKKHEESLRKIMDFSKKTQERLRDLREQRHALKNELSSLKDEENVRPVPRTRLALEEELKELEQQREACEAERDGKKQKIEELKEKRNVSKDELEKFNEKLDKLQRRVNNQDGKITENNDNRKKMAFMKANSGQQVQKLKETLRSNEERKIEAELDLQQRLTDVQGICPERVDSKRPLTEIKKLLDKKEQYLKAAEKLSGSKQEVMTDYREKKEAYETKLHEQNEIKDNIKFFTKSVYYRIDLFNEKRKLCAQEVSYYFRASLLTRGYDGMLQFDFNDERLELEVHPHRNENGDKRKDVKTLSGGERSYSTVSFILAMWRAVVMPFYFLDEFDVFMDKVNRKVVMDLLLAYASEKTNTQFVFITPQDISSITATDTISVFKMPDPERNLS